MVYSTLSIGKTSMSFLFILDTCETRIYLTVNRYAVCERQKPIAITVTCKLGNILKQEFSISDLRINRSEIENVVKKSIEIYNNFRPHFSCQLMTPNQAHLTGKFDYKKWGNLGSMKFGINNIF